MIFEQIKKDIITAMKERRLTDLSVLKMLSNELNKKAKDLRIEFLDDANSVQIIQKFIKSLEEEKNAYSTAGRVEKAAELETQINLVKVYLPKMMSEDEIRSEISKLEDKSIPSVMKYFKTNFTGKVDMGLVSKIARE